jgi:hypothetical protein
MAKDEGGRTDKLFVLVVSQALVIVAFALLFLAYYGNVSQPAHGLLVALGSTLLPTGLLSLFFELTVRT